MEKAETILICGAMANTFLEANGIHMGSSRVERDKLDLARELMALAKQKNVRLILPIDVLCAEEIKPGAMTRDSGRITHDFDIPEIWQAVDIGPETIALFQGEIARAKTILWNGPPGIFEILEFFRRDRSDCRSNGRFFRNHYYRRRRFGDGGETGGPGRQDDFYLHRRRRVARVTGRQGIPRRRGADGQASDGALE